jgi:hypothetical protein
MKIKSALLVLLSSFLLHPSAFAQGPLTPPGPPAPTMKSLDQIEPRRPISSAPFTISTSGSYYLTKNLAVSGGNAITVTTDDVTLDLNGFTISSKANPAAGSGVRLSDSRRNITIRNGTIRGAVEFSGGNFSGAGFLDGISFAGLGPNNILVIDLRVSGCLDDGIDLSTTGPTSVTRCVVHTVGGSGIVAGSVDSCSARVCGASGIVADNATNSLGESTGGSPGLFAVTANNCRGLSETGQGLSATDATNCRGESNGGGSGLSAMTALNCRGTSKAGPGIMASNANNCTGTSTSGVGLSAVIATNCIAFSTSGSAAIDVLGTASYCRGQRDGGTAIDARIAIGCTSGGGTITAPGGKFLGTP